jgi:hypothetical protein
MIKSRDTIQRVNLSPLCFSFESKNKFGSIIIQILAHENLANITQMSQNITQKTFSFSWKFHQTYRMQKHKKSLEKEKEKIDQHWAAKKEKKKGLADA